MRAETTLCRDSVQLAFSCFSQSCWHLHQLDLRDPHGLDGLGDTGVWEVPGTHLCAFSWLLNRKQDVLI